MPKAALFVIGKTGNNPNILQWVINQTMVYPYHGILLSNEEQTPDTYNNLDELC